MPLPAGAFLFLCVRIFPPPLPLPHRCRTVDVESFVKFCGHVLVICGLLMNWPAVLDRHAWRVAVVKCRRVSE